MMTTTTKAKRTKGNAFDLHKTTGFITGVMWILWYSDARRHDSQALDCGLLSAHEYGTMS